MSSPVDVNVDPSSSTRATSGATSGGGGLVFSFGPNPNLGFLSAGNARIGGVPMWALYGAGALVVGLLLWKLKR